MFNFTLQEINTLSAKHRFNRDTLEKILRLVDLLKKIQQHPELKEVYVLKGGTAINLCLVDLPRLSVDIDLDFNRNCSKNEMQEIREKHRKIFKSLVQLEGYTLDPNSRSSFALDGYILKYTNLVNNPDNIKLDINYLNRVHVFEPFSYRINSQIIDSFSIHSLNKIELYGSKIAALLSRTAARDVYDVFMSKKLGIILPSEFNDLKKVALFYLLNSSETTDLQLILKEFYSRMEEFSFWNVKRNLLPLLRMGTNIELDGIKSTVVAFIKDLFILDQAEKDYVEAMNQKVYSPHLLFSDEKIVSRLMDHPSAQWRIAKVKVR